MHIIFIAVMSILVLVGVAANIDAILAILATIVSFIIGIAAMAGIGWMVLNGIMNVMDDAGDSNYKILTGKQKEDGGHDHRGNTGKDRTPAQKNGDKERSN